MREMQDSEHFSSETSVKIFLSAFYFRWPQSTKCARVIYLYLSLRTQ